MALLFAVLVLALYGRCVRPAATRYRSTPGHDCMQIPLNDIVAPPGTPPSEDCFALNAWRPTVRAAAPLPVMVWIHGGWYVNGGSSSSTFDGSALARQGIVVVTINDRLGRFGFFAHPALLAAKEGPVGNFGYMDQIAALHWVRRNISAFGGDPANVTIVGASAGGASVLHLLTSPATKGLFERAIVMSGGGRRAVAERKMTGGTVEAPSADMVDAAFAKTLEVTGEGKEALAALRALSAKAVVGDLNFPVLTKVLLTQGTNEYLPGTPMIDGVTAIDKLEKMFLSG